MATPKQAAKHRWHHVITNALGGNSADVSVELHKLVLVPGDRLLLCTDGLSNMVADPEISGVLQSAAEPEQACRTLVDLANAAGGKDNITVVCAFCDSAN